jgi:hypothetical protein
MAFTILCFSVLTINAQNINLHGKITDKDGKAIAKAVVELLSLGLNDTTAGDGAYSIIKSNTGIFHLSEMLHPSNQISINQGVLELTLSNPSPLNIAIFDVDGNLLKREVAKLAPAGEYQMKINRSIATRVVVIRVTTGQQTMNFRCLPLNNGQHRIIPSISGISQVSGALAAAVDSIKVTAAGYVTKVEALASLEQEKNITLEAESGYHTLQDWVEPGANYKNHHGRMYFIANAQKDDQGEACNSCHGQNFEGSESAPSCESCHDNWRSCDFCHGTSSSKVNPPRGVFDESGITTLAVGRHVAHLNAGRMHSAFQCNTCHAVPAANDLTHLLSYKASTDLTTAGHHGDVKFSGVASATKWNVDATTGNPITARGTCLGTCHSNGRGGNPTKIPYWAGGTWTSNCTNCHGVTGMTGGREHGHGFPGSNCSDCHEGASANSYNSPLHMNGVRDFKTSPGGRASGIRLTANWSCSNVSCHEGDD